MSLLKLVLGEFMSDQGLRKRLLRGILIRQSLSLILALHVERDEAIGDIDIVELRDGAKLKGKPIIYAFSITAFARD